jgi:putative PIN family toxin of toxin-antitoxin system
MSSGVLVDTSVWIDFFNNRKTVHSNLLHDLLISDRRICICPTILQEVLQGLASGPKFKQVFKHLMIQEIVLCEQISAAVESAKLYNDLRLNGVTIRKSNDCLIAYHAMVHNLKLLSTDRDFIHIADHTALELI